MERAIEQMKLDPRVHKVGAVLVAGSTVYESHGSQAWKTHHAESFLLTKPDLSASDLSKATLYTTLEPCTTRTHPHKDCALLCYERRIKRVVVGVLDPNPNISGGGRLFLRKHGIQVDRFDDDLQKIITDFMEPWYSEQRRKKSYEEIFSILQHQISPELKEFSGITVGSSIVLKQCPDITRGWLLSEIPVGHATTQFTLPAELEKEYSNYFSAERLRKGFDQDGQKVMLSSKPKAFSDAPKLNLYTQETLFSKVLFVRDLIATVPELKKHALQEFLAGPLPEIIYPHSLCLHLIVVTSDDHILITRRAPDVEYYPNTWSSSIEENMSPIRDLAPGQSPTLLTLCQKALFEELGLGPDAYNPANLRLLSVFLESDILNVSLCAIATLSITCQDLRKLLRGMPRIDSEFTAWDFLQYREDELIPEIVDGSMPYHPTSKFRLLMALLHRNGLPTNAERFFTIDYR